MRRDVIWRFDSASAEGRALLGERPLSYFSTPVFLDYCGFVVPRGEEKLVTVQDALYPNPFPSLFLPRLAENWQHCLVVYADDEAVAQVRQEGIEVLVCTPVGDEYYYTTDQFACPRRSVRRMVNLFAQRYASAYRIHEEWPHDDVLAFYDHWARQRSRSESFAFEEEREFFLFCLNHLEAYDIRCCYIEVDGALAGLAWGVLANGEKGDWVLLHRKVDYRYKGLSRFLLHVLAGRFPSGGMVAAGTGCQDAGIIAHKESLSPCVKRSYSYLITGGKA